MGCLSPVSGCVDGLWWDVYMGLGQDTKQARMQDFSPGSQNSELDSTLVAQQKQDLTLPVPFPPSADP